MRRLPTRLWTVLWCCLMASVVRAEDVGITRAGMATDDGFRLEEFLGRTWRGEVVRFPLTGKAVSQVQADHALVMTDNRSVPYQIVTDAESQQASIAFAADLDPWQTRMYRFSSERASSATDLVVEQSEQWIRLSNRRVGISIRRALREGEGPLEAIRLASGKWIGDSRLSGLPTPSEFQAEIVADGPVFAEIVCRAKFNDRCWQMRFSLQASDPVIVVQEEFALGQATSMTINLARNFAPEAVLYRYGKGAVGTAATWEIADDPEPVFVLEPWLRWWERQRQGIWFGLYRDGEPDLLAVGAGNASVWVDPLRDRALQSAPRLLVTREGEDLLMTLPLEDGRRRWFLAATDREASLEVLRGSDLCRAPLPQQLFVTHGDYPLDLVKDFIIDWPGDHDNYPRLFVRKGDLTNYRSTFAADPAQLAQYIHATVSPYTMDGPVRYYLGTGDVQLGKHLAETARDWLQASVQMYLEQDQLLNPGFAPHHQTSVLTSMNLADAILGTDALPPDMRRRLRAQIAFLGYTVDRADFWSPERGFSANPNMTTTVAAFKTAVACMIPSHPMAATWLRHGLAELKDEQLDRWSDAQGGWLEAPHYAMVSYDYLVGCFLMVHNAGLADYLYDPKMKKIGQWFAQISTPPDSRLSGHRHFPPIGNTYICEPTGEFAVLAYLWRDRDPEFASHMQWMHRQHGSPEAPGIGGFFPTLAGYRTILRDDSIASVPPQYASKLFPETGAVLRSGFPSDRETMLYLIAGNNHDHYDKDSGSVTLWGKGRIVADDFGYYGYVTGEDHSMLLSPAASDAERMRITKFHTMQRFDYVRGEKTSWTRQVAFVKDPDPLGPNYFVFCDSLAKPVDASWRLWLTCDKVTIDNQVAQVKGKEDVDTDVAFVMPANVELSTDTISRTSASGIAPDGRQGPTTTTQTGILATIRDGINFMVVVYPRLRNQQPAAVTSIAEGKGVKIEMAAGIDYVFLSPRRFTFHQDDLAFEGTSGMIQVRSDGTYLALGAPGRIAFGSQALEEPAGTASGDEK